MRSSFFFNELNSVTTEMILGPDIHEIMEKVMHLKIFLETTLSHIENRPEVAGMDITMDNVTGLINQYL